MVVAGLYVLLCISLLVACLSGNVECLDNKRCVTCLCWLWCTECTDSSNCIKCSRNLGVNWWRRQTHYLCVLPSAHHLVCSLPCVWNAHRSWFIDEEGQARVQSVLLLTDGLTNEGIKSKDGILGEMRKLQSPPDQTDDRKVRWG